MTATKTVPGRPEQVFDRVADLGRMPELSPECVKIEWVKGDGSGIGDQFKGWNRIGPAGWWTNGWIIERARPGRLVVETSTIYGERNEPTNRWTYEFQEIPDGTRVVERLDTLRLPIHLRALGPFLLVRWLQLKFGMNRTLSHLARELAK